MKKLIIFGIVLILLVSIVSAEEIGEKFGLQNEAVTVINAEVKDMESEIIITFQENGLLSIKEDEGIRIYEMIKKKSFIKLNRKNAEIIWATITADVEEDSKATYFINNENYELNNGDKLIFNGKNVKVESPSFKFGNYQILSNCDDYGYMSFNNLILDSNGCESFSVNGVEFTGESKIILGKDGLKLIKGEAIKDKIKITSENTLIITNPDAEIIDENTILITEERIKLQSKKDGLVKFEVMPGNKFFDTFKCYDLKYEDCYANEKAKLNVHSRKGAVIDIKKDVDLTPRVDISGIGDAEIKSGILNYNIRQSDGKYLLGISRTQLGIEESVPIRMFFNLRGKYDHEIIVGAHNIPKEKINSKLVEAPHEFFNWDELVSERIDDNKKYQTFAQLQKMHKNIKFEAQTSLEQIGKYLKEGIDVSPEAEDDYNYFVETDANYRNLSREEQIKFSWWASAAKPNVPLEYLEIHPQAILFAGKFLEEYNNGEINELVFVYNHESWGNNAWADPDKVGRMGVGVGDTLNIYAPRTEGSRDSLNPISTTYHEFLHVKNYIVREEEREQGIEGETITFPELITVIGENEKNYLRDQVNKKVNNQPTDSAQFIRKTIINACDAEMMNLERCKFILDWKCEKKNCEDQLCSEYQAVCCKKYKNSPNCKGENDMKSIDTKFRELIIERFKKVIELPSYKKMVKEFELNKIQRSDYIKVQAAMNEALLNNNDPECIEFNKAIKNLGIFDPYIFQVEDLNEEVTY